MLEMFKTHQPHRRRGTTTPLSDATASLKHSLFAKWEQRATDYERDGCLVNGSRLVKQFIDDLTQFCRDQADTVVGLMEATRISGYSSDHLRRMARNGKLENVSGGRSLAFRVGQLPRKPKRIASPAAFDAGREIEKLRDGAMTTKGRHLA